MHSPPCCCRHVSDGNEILLRPRFEVETVLDDIERKRASVFSGVPTMWIGLLNHAGSEGRDFSSLRTCMSGGAPLPFEVEQRAERLLGRRLLGGWGMTETCPAGTRVPARATPRPGLIGAPLPGIEMRVVALDDPSRIMPTGELGEIAIRGANVFSGYWNQPEVSAKAFHDGFFLTGDIGRMDEDGLFVLKDRKKNMIISSGFNVYPAAIENAIYEHHDVEEAIVIGIPDPYRGQAAKAFLKLRPGAPDITLAALRGFPGGADRTTRDADRARTPHLAAAQCRRQAAGQRADRGGARTGREPGRDAAASRRNADMTDAVIVSVARTPIGRAFRGSLNLTHGADLAAHAMRNAIERAGIDPGEIEDVVIGCGTPEGATGGNIARQSAFRAGLPASGAAQTVSRFCASGLQAIATAARAVSAGDVSIAVAGGVESISLVQPTANKHHLRNRWLEEHKPDL